MNLSRLLGCLGFGSGIVLVAALLAGCQTELASDQYSEAAGLKTASVGSPEAGGVTTNGPNEEILNVGDSLTINYADLPVVTPPFVGKIKGDGTITLLFSETFVAKDKTRGQLEKEIHDRYVPRYFSHLTATVQ